MEVSLGIVIIHDGLSSLCGIEWLLLEDLEGFGISKKALVE
jgi:hypothetical protein